MDFGIRGLLVQDQGLQTLDDVFSFNVQDGVECFDTVLLLSDFFIRPVCGHFGDEIIIVIRVAIDYGLNDLEVSNVVPPAALDNVFGLLDVAQHFYIEVSDRFRQL